MAGQKMLNSRNHEPIHIFAHETTSEEASTAYHPPTRGPLSIIPASWVPYGQLMRLDKPAGYFAFYFPHLFGLLFAQAVMHLKQQLCTHFYIFFGCIFLRGAACTWNDILDAAYDRQVARCRLRPIARYAVSRSAALLFTVIQTAVGVMTTLAPLPHGCRAPAMILTATQAVYPLLKRVTNYPQLWLGFSFAFGIGVGAGSGGVDFGKIFTGFVADTTAIRSKNFPQQLATPKDSDDKNVGGALACMFAAVMLNTLIYDTIYGHQDLVDDLNAGVKSVAVAWRDKTKRNCAILAVVEVGFLVETSFIARLGAGFDILAIGGTSIVLTTMLYSVQLKDSASCMRCFNWLIWGTGTAMTLGLLST